MKSLSNLEWSELGEFPCLSISSSALGPTLRAPKPCCRPSFPPASPPGTSPPHPCPTCPSTLSLLLSPPLKVSTFEEERVLRSWVKEKEKLLLGSLVSFPPFPTSSSSSLSKSQSLKHLSLSSGSLRNLVSTRFGFLGLASSCPTTWRRIFAPAHFLTS